MTLLFALILAVIWGAIWAGFLQWTDMGQFLALKRTWITVVVGVGMDMLIILLVVSFEQWVQIVAVVAASSVFIIVRSLWNERAELREVLGGYTDQAGE